MSREANATFLSHFFTSKEHFTAEYKKLSTSKAKELYLSSLSQLKETIIKDSIDDFQQTSTLILYITEEEKQHTLRTYYEDQDNLIGGTNLVILACKYNRVKILKFIFDGNGILDNLTVDIGRSAITGDDIDDECHNAFYYAIRSNNIELLDELIHICRANYFADPSTELDDILSRTYEELKLKKVPLLNKIEVFVESQLIDIRFYSNDYEQDQSPEDDIETIRARIQMTLVNILLLVEKYSNAEVDDKFLFIVKFIVQNIFVLKHQLKSTYDRLPWEEMEFCLICFSSLYIKRRHVLNLFYNATLSKGRILTHLFNFATQLQRLNCFVKSEKISDLATRLNLKRDKVVEEITQLHPQFENLYADYQQVRDVCSLQKISDYIILALSVNPETEEGQLTLCRCLQVIGEFLKNTLESPKMSNTTRDQLVLSLPKNTRDIVITLRNSLSHASSLAKRTKIEEIADVNYFSGIQNDIKKIGAVIADILCKNKIKTIQCLLKKIVDCKNSEQIRQLSDVLCATEFENLITIDLKSSDQEKLEKLIEELSESVTNKTTIESELFKRINDIIIFEKSEIVRKDYIRGQKFIIGLKSFLEEFNIGPHETTGIKCFAEETLQSFAPHVPSQNIKEICKLSRQIISSFSSREQWDLHDNILKIISEIFYLVAFRVNEIKEIKKFREKLNSKVSFIPTKKRMLTPVKHSKTSAEQLLQKLSTLTNVLRNNALTDQFIEKHSSYKENSHLQAVIEMLVLDIISILDVSKNLFEDSRFCYDDSSPLLIGKCLRNHLAHDNALINVQLSDPTIAILVNANKLAEENAMKKNKNIGKVVKDDSIKLKERFYRGLSTITNQERMFAAIEKGYLEELMTCIKKGGDIYALDINSRTTLHFAGKGAKLEMLEFIFKNNINAGIKDVNGGTPLHIAAEYGRIDILQYLISVVGCDVNDVNNIGRTPLHIAAGHGHSDDIELLLKLKAKLTAKDKCNCPPLYYSMSNDQIDASFVLLKCYTSDQINEAEAGHAPLHIAAAKGQLSLVDYLLQNKADVNVKDDNGYTPLHAAAFNGHVETAEALILSGADVQAKVIGGCTPLHYAVKNGHEMVVDFLLENDAKVNVADIDYKNTPLHYAAMDGFDAIVKKLLKFKADPDLTTSEGMTAIHLAAHNGHLGILFALLEHGVDVNVKEINQCTPLHLAADRGHKDIAEVLIKYEAEVNAKSVNNVTPLHIASAKGYRDAAHLLLKSKAKVNVQDIIGNTPLHYAALNGFVNIIDLLMENGADVDSKNWNDFTALHFSATKPHEDAVACLIRNRANVNAIADFGVTPLHGATFEGCTNIAGLLIENKAEVNSRDSQGITPFDFAVRNGQKDIAELLLRNGADVHSELYDNKSALLIAVENNHKELVEVLIANGANVDENDGEALMFAVGDGYLEIVKIFLKNGARISVENSKKWTLLHVAVSRGHKEVVNILIQKGAAVDAVTIENDTALHLAAYMGHDDIIELLLAKGTEVNAKCVEGKTALHIAAAKGHASVVQVLLENKCNVNLKDCKKRTALELAVGNGPLQIVKMIMPFDNFGINNNSNDDWPLLHIASQENNLQMVSYLVDKGADIHASNSLGLKAIHIATKEESTNIVEFFLSLGLSVDEVGTADITLLHYAALNGSLNASKYLITQGADVNAQSRFGESPLIIAAFCGHKDIVEVLLENGAVYNLVDLQNKSPQDYSSNKEVITLLTSTAKLFDAVRRGKLSDVECCIDAGARANAKDVHTHTPLHYAAWKGYHAIAQCLLRNRANPNSVAKMGYTPLHYAAQFSHLKLVKALLSCGAIHDAFSDSNKTPADFASDSDVINLLKLVRDSFNDVEAGSVRVIVNLSQIKNMEVLKAIMRAHNRKKQTLVMAAFHHKFFQVGQLKELAQMDVTNVTSALELLQQDQSHKA